MKLTETTRGLREAGQKVLVPFFTAGYPDEQTFLALLETAARAGCRVIEIGVPFSDPIADGPVIQESSQQVLAGGMTLRRALELTAEASARTDAALVMMGYVNPLLAMGLEEFAAAARQAGVAGVIVPDTPLEESADVRRALGDQGVALVDLVAPTSSEKRVGRIAAKATGFLYLVSMTGVTGAGLAPGRQVADLVARVRRRTDLPLYVGFGVSRADQAAAIVQHADGVIIGSALIRLIQAAPSGAEAVTRVEAFLGECLQAMNSQRSE